MFKAPSFWKTVNLISLILYPFSILYSCISKCKYSTQTPTRLDCKVICIGNVTLGGSGKTPLAIAIGKLLLSNKNKIAYACKNYRSSIKTPTCITSSHNITQVLDEAFLLNKIAPTFIAKERKEAIKIASEKAKIVISDDGLQNNSFYKNLSILAVPKDKAFGNNFIFPAGPLREYLEDALTKTDLVIMIDEKNNSHQKSRLILEKHFPKTKIFKTTAQYKFSGSYKKKYIAFCGIAYPENFFITLTRLGIKIIDRLSFPDHHKYSKKDLQKLFDQAKKLNVDLITTEKDFMRLDENHKKKISYLQYDLEILDKKIFKSAFSSTFG